MSTTIVSETLIAAAEAQTVTTKLTTGSAAAVEVELAKCDCCELTEECTLGYIERIRGRYMGNWVCGLCAEAVKDEMVRCERLISMEEALARHFNFCKKFRTVGPPSDAAVHLISAVRQLLRRSLDSPRSLKSMPCSPRKSSREIRSSMLTRSGSCFSSLSVEIKKEEVTE